ncbi:Neuronal acetylcholine receptor subunit alpha-7 [Holothuria leucospilota]|uniref:Neuronal acetylcholine receptor subunit alpha-7 n=1 Tax=Holothuria leucospilota TaxID=206669 RepID=A0A9Q1H3D6_HOLLE|nr:Neuronal acetylcholine receptor subunit alpha-7 [Holothuria leucospilota]
MCSFFHFYQNEQKQRLSVVGVIYMGWVDELLTWDPKDYGGVERISLRMDEIWIPDTTASERLDVGKGYINLFEPYVMVNSTGHVSYFDLSDLTVYCRMNMSYFPFDIQKCKISFLSFGYDSDQLILAFSNTSSANENTFAPNGVWELVDVTVQQVDVYYLCCPIPYVEIHYEFILRRIGKFYVYSIWIPSGLLSLLLIAVFAMHPNSGEKVSLSVSTVLAFILFQQIVVESMPRSGDDSPIIVAYFSAMIVISCLSVFGSAVVLRVYHHNSKTPVPWIFQCLIRRSYVTVASARKSPTVIPSDCREKRQNDEHVTDERLPEQTTDVHQVFPVRIIDEFESTFSDIHKGKDALHNGRNNLVDIDCRVSKTSSRHVNDHSTSDYETDWMLLALMLDKIFLAVAVLAMLGTLLYCVVRFQM